MTDPQTYMKRCLQLAGKGKGHVAPNPMVGAVLAHEDRIIGEGWHSEYGKAHAEVNCLQSVQPEDRHLIPASTMYVSLEPCAHHGKTPPCAERLIREEVKRVIVCNEDPFKEVDGKGLEMLNLAGIETQTGLLGPEGRWLNRRFFCFHEQKRPYIILKWAQTSTGYFAPADRSRFQITGRHSQQLVHKWRTEESAIMVGYNTALNDDPLLTARLWQGKQPLRIIIDKHLELPAHLHVFNNDARTWILNKVKQATGEGVSFIRSNFGKDFLQELLSAMYRENLTSLIVEGGAALLNSFIEQGLWDEARVFSAESTLADGIPAPLLKQAEWSMQTIIGQDQLNIHTRQNSRYPYVAGMEL